jgi:hypothetical protein
LKVGSKKVSCDVSEALCNPVLFCQGKVAPRSKQFQPIRLCVKIAKREDKNDAITQKCLDAVESLPDAAPGDVMRRCSPEEVVDFAYVPEWKELKESTEAQFKKLCVEHGDFQALFCTECSIMAEKIFTMNKAATGSGCAADAPGAARARAEDQQGSAAAPAATSPPSEDAPNVEREVDADAL